MTDGLSELKDVDRVSVYEAGKELAGAAVRVLARGLAMPDREVGYVEQGALLLRSLVFFRRTAPHRTVGRSIRHARAVLADLIVVGWIQSTRRVDQMKNGLQTSLLPSRLASVAR